MNNPIFQTIGNQPAGDTTGLLQMAMNISLPRLQNRRKDVSLFNIARTRNMAQSSPKPIATITKPVSSLKTPPNKYGVADRLWNTVSPYIDKYQLGVIEGLRDRATASSRSAKNSQHYLGNAIDIDYSRLNPNQRRELVSSLKEAGLGGFGLGRNTLHIDIGRPRFWYYDDKGNWSRDSRYMPEWSRGLF